MAKVIMIQGTMSSAGKSYVVAGLCRVFHQDGYRVAPFKSQNMALNSYVTRDGLEMGRAQVMQAEAAGIEPCADMNPILLKPTSDTGSQVIVNGIARGNMDARDYFAYKKELIPDIKAAFRRLSRQVDIIVIEGAGSPAEINLKENDIVNMGIAKMVDAPVLLVGDIDRGGVFAQLVGTVSLLERKERERIRGFIINKFRGDPSLLTSGVDMLTEQTGIPVTGILPYLPLALDDEDSLSERLETKQTDGENPAVDIAVIRLPHISNFTDFDVFDMIPDCSVRYVTDPGELEGADLVVLPGSKNTIGDLGWLWRSGLGEAICHYAAQGRPVWGICGGYQMLGFTVEDADHVETGGEDGSAVQGLGLLPVRTLMREEKTLRQVKGYFAAFDKNAGTDTEHPQGAEPLTGTGHPQGAEPLTDTEHPQGAELLSDTDLAKNGRLVTASGGKGSIWNCLSGMRLEGYEIHMGQTCIVPVRTWLAQQADAADHAAMAGGHVIRSVKGTDSMIHKDSVWNETGAFVILDRDGASPATDKNVRACNNACNSTRTQGMAGCIAGNVCGSYIHGIFDAEGIAEKVVCALRTFRSSRDDKDDIMVGHGNAVSSGSLAGQGSVAAGGSVAGNPGVTEDVPHDYHHFKEHQYDLLADMIRSNMDMQAVYACLREAAL